MKKIKKIFKGEIFYANLDPVVGHEQGGNRPVLILQENSLLKNCPTILVAPLTKLVNKRYDLPTHVYIEPSKYLKYNSVVLLEHIKEIDKSRLNHYIATLNSKQQQEVDLAIIKILGLNKERDFFYEK